LEKDPETGIVYPIVSIIQVGYISENFQLNIEASKTFEKIREDLVELQLLNAMEIVFMHLD